MNTTANTRWVDTKRHKHDLVHVEVFIGGGGGAPAEATVGSRFEGPGVEAPGVHTLRWRLPSPRWPKPETRAPCGAMRARVSSTRS